MSKKRTPNYKARRFVALLIVAIVGLGGAIIELESRDWQNVELPFASQFAQNESKNEPPSEAQNALETLEVKGRAAKTGYARTQFGNGWDRGAHGCDMRNTILQRDLTEVETDENCKVQRGILHDAYTGKEIAFVRAQASSADVQIGHVVALSNAWQTGAQLLSPEERREFANDPLNLLAVDGLANQQKGDGDAATWLPANRGFRCSYVARQIAVKQRYMLWVTPAEKDAMARVLGTCPGKTLPAEK